MRPLGPADPPFLGEYRLLGILGAGGMGRVYLGRNARGRTVAVKVVRPELADDDNFRTRFAREVDAARRVGGPYTAPVLDADVEADPPWLATGFVAGLPLDDAVARHGVLPEPALAVLAGGLAKALLTVHDAGIVHRDLKPSNVILAVDGPKVIDFGIARAADDSALTTSGNIIGSPGFMCPEQINGEPLGPAGDVFSMGGVLVYAATGRGPFGQGDTVAMLYRVMQQPAQLDGVPDSLRPLVAACLEKRPHDRPTVRNLVAEFGDRPTSGWVPGPILEEVSTRAVELLSLEQAAPLDPPAAARYGFAAPERHPRADTTAVRLGAAAGSPPAGPTFGTAAARYGTGPDPASVRSSHDGGDRAPQRADPAAWPQPSDSGKSNAVKQDRRQVLFAVALLVVAALVAGGFVALWQLRDNGGSPGTSPGRPPAALPAEFTGTWTGTASDGFATFDIEVTLTGGTVGGKVGTASNTGQASQTRCARDETLTAVDGPRITLRATLSEGQNCMDDGSESSLELQPDGSARYRMDGPIGAIGGKLTKR